MSYRLQTPYNLKQRADFIVEYNHRRGLRIESLGEDLYALEENEIIVNNEVIIDPDYEAKKAQEERKRLDGLMMTRGDVFEALILAKGLGKAQLRGMIDAYEVDEVTKALYLNRFDEALNFYRGYPIFDLLGEVVGITSEMWDRFFESKDWKELISDDEE